jgi:hypothetical protein
MGLQIDDSKTPPSFLGRHTFGQAALEGCLALRSDPL